MGPVLTTSARVLITRAEVVLGDGFIRLMTLSSRVLQHNSLAPRGS